VRFGLLVDFRNPAGSGFTNSEIYRATLDNIAYAEDLGFEDVWLSEHHFAEDGYCPAPLTVSAAIAVRTRRLAIGQSVFLLPLHNPLRVAEEGAVVDILSEGRFMFCPALGYRPSEFEIFGVDRRRRASIFEEALEVIKQAWTEGVVNFNGQHFRYENVMVRPLPVQRPRPPIWIGGLSEPAIKRAARLGDGLMAGGRRAYRWYIEGLREAGKPVNDVQMAGPSVWYFVDPDPARLRRQIEPQLLHFHNTVVEWFQAAGQAMPHGNMRATSAEQLERDGRYVFCTPEECARQILEYVREVPISRFYMLASLPGLDPRISRRWLDVFARDVIPAVRAGLKAA
jgi:alkanesulfonate monooxygenase SsuD/methylene tetrahydromethanopterin reductase-like flavin-dependent oxidoreductase (luciferase family)